MDWLLGIVCCLVGLLLGATLGLIIAGMMTMSYEADELHGRQEWQQVELAEELFGKRMNG